MEDGKPKSSDGEAKREQLHRDNSDSADRSRNGYRVCGERMNNDAYWKLTVEERKEADKQEAKESMPKEKFYLWTYCKSYGWRQMGNCNGYKTLKELEEDSSYKFYVENGDIFQIMKAVTWITKEVEE